jgi:hypothetical protein
VAELRVPWVQQGSPKPDMGAGLEGSRGSGKLAVGYGRGGRWPRVVAAGGLVDSGGGGSFYSDDRERRRNLACIENDVPRLMIPCMPALTRLPMRQAPNRRTQKAVYSIWPEFREPLYAAFL